MEESSQYGAEFAGQLEIPATSEQETRPERHGMCVN